VRSELKNLGVNTFGDLAIDDHHLPPERRYSLVVTVADLTTGQMDTLPGIPRLSQLRAYILGGTSTRVHSLCIVAVAAQAGAGSPARLLTAGVLTGNGWPGGPSSSCLSRQEAGEWIRLLDNVDCHIDCRLRLLVCQRMAAMSCAVTWLDKVTLQLG